jgi:hypothetical protein
MVNIVAKKGNQKREPAKNMKRRREEGERGGRERVRVKEGLVSEGGGAWWPA